MITLPRSTTYVGTGVAVGVGVRLAVGVNVAVDVGVTVNVLVAVRVGSRVLEGTTEGVSDSTTPVAGKPHPAKTSPNKTRIKMRFIIFQLYLLE
jgi:hypothetical protein